MLADAAQLKLLYNTISGIANNNKNVTVRQKRTVRANQVCEIQVLQSHQFHIVVYEGYTVKFVRWKRAAPRIADQPRNGEHGLDRYRRCRHRKVQLCHLTQCWVHRLIQLPEVKYIIIQRWQHPVRKQTNEAALQIN